MIFKKILKVWLDDIYENQKDSIIKGTKFKHTINNPKDYIKIGFTALEKGLNICRDYFK